MNRRRKKVSFSYHQHSSKLHIIMEINNKSSRLLQMLHIHCMMKVLSTDKAFLHDVKWVEGKHEGMCVDYQLLVKRDGCLISSKHLWKLRTTLRLRSGLRVFSVYFTCFHRWNVYKYLIKSNQVSNECWCELDLLL